MADLSKPVTQNGCATMLNGKAKVMGDPPVQKKPKINGNELEQFDALFPTLVDDLTSSISNEKEISAALKWFKRVCEYNVPFGKKNRGMMVVQAFSILKDTDITEDELHKARILGWCIEWLQAYFLVADDIMDQSVTRRGQPCWYKVDGVGLEAVNDALYLENAVFILLKKYFKPQPYYADLLELFHETSMSTITGQSLDMITAPIGKVDFSQFTMERYKTIVKYKTAFYSFYLPVACAMHMAGEADEKDHESAKAILLKMGEFFQIQDDYLDCYGDPAVTGKIGRDIEDNKCSWLCVQALSMASAKQRQMLEDNYGQEDPEKVAVVKDLFKELKLQKLYSDYEESSYQDIMQMVDNLKRTVPKEIFYVFAKKIYKRNK